VRKNGEVRHLQVFRKEILWNGERQFQTIYQDITERKRAEEEKRRLEERSLKIVEDIFRFIPEGVLVFSRKMELLRQNQAFRELVSGYAKRLGFAEDELENLIIDKIKAGLGDKNLKEKRISRKHKTGEKT
jgi:PAS domain-containing protein